MNENMMILCYKWGFAYIPRQVPLHEWSCPYYLERCLFITNHDYYLSILFISFFIYYIHNIAFLFRKPLSSKLIAEKACHLFLCLVIYSHPSEFLDLLSLLIQDDQILWDKENCRIEKGSDHPKSILYGILRSLDTLDEFLL